MSVTSAGYIYLAIGFTLYSHFALSYSSYRICTDLCVFCVRKVHTSESHIKECFLFRCRSIRLLHYVFWDIQLEWVDAFEYSFTFY